MANLKRYQEAMHKLFERPGIIFMSTVWMQSQMTDLLILKKHPNIRAEFLNSDALNPIPKVMARERAEYTTKSLENLTEEFAEFFHDLLLERCIHDLKENLLIRNAIAHAQLNTGRASGDYLLHYPRSSRKMDEFITTFELKSPEELSNPPMLVLEFDDQRFGAHWDRCVRISESFRAIAESMDIPYEKIC